MCEVDWNLLNGAVQAVANTVMAIVAVLAAGFALRQVREATHARMMQVALQINSDIQNYRNDTQVRGVRARVLELLDQFPDPTARANAFAADDASIDAIREFMARMNNLCWTIGSLPADSVPNLRDDILSTISSNLVAEWDSVAPLAQARRKERQPQGLEKDRWYMKDFEDIADYARKQFPRTCRPS